MISINDRIVATTGGRATHTGKVVEIIEGDRAVVKWDDCYNKSKYALKNLALESVPYRVIPAEIKGLKYIKPKYVKL